MIPYPLDPSLHPSEPAPQQLDDGFSPPAARQAPAPEGAPVDLPDPSLWRQSEF